MGSGASTPSAPEQGEIKQLRELIQQHIKVAQDLKKGISVPRRAFEKLNSFYKALKGIRTATNAVGRYFKPMSIIAMGLGPVCKGLVPGLKALSKAKNMAQPAESALDKLIGALRKTEGKLKTLENSPIYAALVGKEVLGKLQGPHQQAMQQHQSLKSRIDGYVQPLQQIIDKIEGVSELLEMPKQAAEKINSVINSIPILPTMLSAIGSIFDQAIEKALDAIGILQPIKNWCNSINPVQEYVIRVQQQIDAFAKDLTDIASVNYAVEEHKWLDQIIQYAKADEKLQKASAKQKANIDKQKEKLADLKQKEQELNPGDDDKGGQKKKENVKNQITKLTEKIAKDEAKMERDTKNLQGQADKKKNQAQSTGGSVSNLCNSKPLKFKAGEYKETPLGELKRFGKSLEDEFKGIAQKFAKEAEKTGKNVANSLLSGFGVQI